MKPIDATKLTKSQLKALIKNHEDQEATAAPLYAEALAELERRNGKGLDFDKSYAIVVRAAKEGRFLSYKELADESGAKWDQVYRALGGHLYRLVYYAHRRGWPMLSAIVVNQKNVETGEMEPETLKGFIGAARELGIPVTAEKAFLKDQQQKVFDWAASLPE